MASQSMADYLKTAGWLVLVGWWLTPIITLLVNKLFARLFSDVSRKLRNLETITVPDLNHAKNNALEQRMRRSFEDKGSPDDLKTLAKIEEDLKSAFYEAQDIMDTIKYHRIEEEVLGYSSSWVQCRLDAAGGCIVGCFRRSWFYLWRHIDVTRAALQQFSVKPPVPSPDSPPTVFEETTAAAEEQGGPSPMPPLQLRGHISRCVWRHIVAAGTNTACCFINFWSCLGRCVNGARAKLLSWAQSLFWKHLLVKSRGGTRTLGALLPISVVKISVSESMGSMVGLGTLSTTSPTALEATTMDATGELGYPKPPLQQPADMVADEEHEKVEEIEEEKVVEEKVRKDAEQDNVEEEIEEVEEEEKVKEEEQRGEEVEEEVDEEKVKEEQKTEENRALFGRVQQYFQAMLIYLTKAIAFARSYRDWSYEEVFGIESNQRGRRAVYSLFPVFGTNSLGKRIKHIENILHDSKKSNLLNQKSSSEIPNNDSNNERTSREIPVKEDTKKERSSRQEQIDDWYRKIERKVFGRDNDLERICKMFRKRSDPYGTTSSNGSKPYSVFGIHGIAGSGKSTLANYICDHEKKAEDKHFDLIMFSHVSMTFRVEKIFCDMLGEITKDQQSDNKGIASLGKMQVLEDLWVRAVKIFCDMLREITKDQQSDNKGITSPGKELMEKLKGSRFLLVLDDLWIKPENQKEREILLDALCAGKNGSIILVTAQNEDAAAALGAEEQMLIPDIEEEEYLSLLMHHALQGTVDDAGRFERIGRRIAKKLHRSPIAAVAVGRRLQAEKSISFWETTANLDVLNETMGALWWSYQQLCADTRRCFQFCSTFPRGHVLDRDELVHIWIALGFVKTRSSNATEVLEDVGQHYLQELVKFSFLQKTYYNSQLYTIHDLLHELAERVAGSDFFRIDDWMGLPVKDIPPSVRHLFIGSTNAAQGAEAAEKDLDLGNLCTLIIEEPSADSPYRKQRMHDLEKIFDRLFRRLRKLRVLIIRLGSISGKLSFPASIDQMKHLRYFSFDCPSAYRWKLILPSTFNKLYQMQTMLFDPNLSVSYPDGMGNLIRLRYVPKGLVFQNICKMTSLQKLDYAFHVKKEGYELKQLKQLNELRGSLEIVELGNVGSREEALEAGLTSKKRVTELKLSFSSSCHTTIDPDMQAEVLDGLCPPENLQELTIEAYDGSGYPSWILSGQQHRYAPKHLRKLVLVGCRCPLAYFPVHFMNLLELTILDCKWDSFPKNMERLVSLQSLHIVGNRRNKMVLLPTLPRSLREITIRGWDFMLENMEHLLSLESLSISHCDKMERLPKLPQSLKEVTIVCCDVLSRTCQEEGHENWQKIQHIDNGKRRIY